MIDAGQSIMRQADSVSYCWTPWLQRARVQSQKFPSQNAPKSGKYRKSGNFVKLNESRPRSRVFLNPWFGEPVVCTLDSRGFAIFVVSVISANPALSSLFVAV